MKKICLALVATLSLSSAVFAQSNQSTGTLVFKGEVTTASCTISPLETIELGTVSTRTLDKAGASSDWVTSTIEFVDCDLKVDDEGQGVESVELVIEPGNSLTNDLWANATGDAKNVGLDLQINNQAIKPAGGSVTGLAILSNNRLSVPVKARMQASATGVEAGTFGATVKFAAQYK